MSITSTDVHELIAESTLDSDAAMIDAITRPTMPTGNVSDMKYGRILSVEKSGGSGCVWKNANNARPTNDSANIQIASPAALTINAWRASFNDLVVCSRCTMIWSEVYDAMRPTTIENMIETTLIGWKKNACIRSKIPPEPRSTGAIADVF